MYNIKLFRNNYRYQVVFILFIIFVIVYWQRVNVSILLLDNKFLEDMGLVGENARQGLLMTLFLIPYSISNIVTAPLGDRIGARKTMIIGLTISAVAMLLGGLAAGLSAMFLARILLGIGQGMYYPTQSIMVKNWFPPEERGKANAIYGVGVVGPLLAMPVFTFLINTYEWNAIFYLVGLLGLACIIPFLNGMITDKPEGNKYTGTKEIQLIKQDSDLNTGNIVKKSDNRELLALISYKEFWILIVSYIAYVSIWWGVVTWLPQYLFIARGFSLESMGLISALPYGFAATGILLGGVLSDKLSCRALFGVVALLGTAACILIAALVPSAAISALFIIICPAFCHLYYAPIWSILQTILPFHLIGTGSGFMNGFSNLISALSPFLMGLLIDISNSYTSGLIYLAAIGGLGAICCIHLTKRNL